MVRPFGVIFEMGFCPSGGQKGQITEIRARNWAIICLVYLLMASGAIMLATNTAIQYFVLGLLQQALSVALSNHLRYHRHRDPRKSSAPDNRSDRRYWGDVQSQCLGSDGSKASIWTGGLGHVVRGRKLTTLLVKRRIRRGLQGDKKKKDRRNQKHNPGNLVSKEKHQEHRNRPQDCYEDHNSDPTAFLYQGRRISIHQLPKIFQKQFNGMSDLSESVNMPATPITIHPIVGIMPRPGQPGALRFDGTGISDFLKDWGLECEEYGLTDAQKYKKLPRYCGKDINEAIQKLDGYKKGDWGVFQRELKKLFWQTDPPKDTAAALFKLIGDTKAGKMSVEIYVLKYTTITDALIRKNAMSKFDHAVRLLEGLSDKIHSKVFEYCSEQGWRMLEHDVETTEPVFEEVKQIVLEKAKMFERRKLFVGGQPGFLGAGSSDTPAASATATM